VGFFRWVYPKKPTGFFWVRTRVSEPWLRALRWMGTIGFSGTTADKQS